MHLQGLIFSLNKEAVMCFCAGCRAIGGVDLMLVSTESEVLLANFVHLPCGRLGSRDIMAK